MREMFGAAGVEPVIARETVYIEWRSEQDAVQGYTNDFGPFLIARQVLDPQGRWEEFVSAFADLARRYNGADDGTARFASEYFLITAAR